MASSTKRRLTMARTSSKAKHSKLRHRKGVQNSMAGLKKSGISSPAWFHGQGGTMKPHNGRAK